MDNEIMKLYKEWASGYDEHMKKTGHYAALEKLLGHIAPRIPQDCVILDPACGTGHVEEYLLSLRPDLSFVVNDASQEMLAVAEGKFVGNNRIGFTDHDINQLLDEFEQFRKEHPNVPRSFVKNPFYTILISYTMYWIGDVQKKQTFAEMCYEILDDRGALISIEEWPLVTTPSSSLSEKVGKMINSGIQPMEPNKLNYEVFFRSGFSTEAIIQTRIDDKHAMYLRLYFKR